MSPAPTTMSKPIDADKIMKDLKELKKDVKYLKNAVDSDKFMTPDEEKKFEAALKRHKEGKSIPIEEVERELGLHND